MRFRRAILALLLGPLPVSCVIRQVGVGKVDPNAEPGVLYGHVKAHLKDGGVILYPRGVELTRDSLLGEGVRSDLTRQATDTVRSFARANVAVMEEFGDDANAAGTVLANGIWIAVVVVVINEASKPVMCTLPQGTYGG